MKQPAIQRNGLYGEHIDFAIRECIKLASKFNRPVRLSFNGYKVNVTKRMRHSHLANQYSHWCKSSSIRYRRTRWEKLLADPPSPDFAAFIEFGRKLAEEREKKILDAILKSDAYRDSPESKRVSFS